MQPNAPVPRRITFDAFTDGWGTLTKDIGIYAVCMLIALILGYVVSLPVTLMMQGAMQAQVSSLPPQQQGLAMLQSPLYWGQIMISNVIGCLVAPLYIGISRMALRRMRGEPIQIGQMFQFEGKYVQLVLFSFLLALVGGIGFALCIIPGLIVYALMLPAGLLILDRGMLATEAMSTSMKAMMPSLGAAIGIVLMCGLCLIGGALLCCIGALFLGPVYFCTQAAVYRELFDYGQPVDPMAQPEGSYYRPPQ